MLPDDESVDLAFLPSPSASSVAPPGQNHHDLPSFLAYASRVNLPVTSSVYVGTHYEYTVRASLARLGMRLRRVGGRSDAGIDLLGQWHLPIRRASIQQEPVRLLVQCKARHHRGGPHFIRELEGAFNGLPPGWAKGGVVGLLAVTKQATAGVREAMGRSRLPLAFAMVEQDGRIVQLLWNRVARDTGLDGLGITLKYVPTSKGPVERDGVADAPMEEQMRHEVALTWRGEVLPSHPVPYP